MFRGCFKTVASPSGGFKTVASPSGGAVPSPSGGGILCIPPPEGDGTAPPEGDATVLKQPLSLFLPLFFLLTFLACAGEESLPISKATLKSTLMDIHLAESAMAHLSGERKDSVAAIYYEQVCKMHGISRAELDSSVAILRRNPVLMEEIYTDMPEELDKLKLELK